MRTRRGSLTVEATISFTIFITVMFLLLTLVKMVLVMIVLNNATTETAKSLAAGGYPIAFLNGIQEDGEELIKNTEPESVAKSVQGTVKASIITQVLGGDGMKTLKGDAIGSIKGIIGGLVADQLKGIVYDLKGQGVNALCGQIIKEYVENCGLYIDQDKLMLRVAKIPETDKEFETLHSESLPLSENGEIVAVPASTPSGTDGDFNAADVVICLEYPYEVNLPFIPSINVKLRSTAVEHAWLDGTHNGPSRKEGIDISNLLFGGDTRVYYSSGGAGKKYHKKDCITQAVWGGREETTLTNALSKGLTPCKVCNPPTKKGG